jgi:hypothetical protein
VSWYNETISEPPPPGVFRFPSDLALSQYPGAQEFWSVFSNSADDQTAWANVGAILNVTPKY